jgi:hypothetical protein
MYELMKKRLAIAREAIACFERHTETTRNKQHVRQASAILKEERQNLATFPRAMNLLEVLRFTESTSGCVCRDSYLLISFRDTNICVV